MDIEALKSFLAIEKYRNFTKAAEDLYCTQAAISMRIKRMEESLNCQLFVRSGRMIELSPEGELLLPYAKQVVHTWEQATKHLLQSQLIEERELHIASSSTPGTYIVPSFIYLFQKKYPYITVVNHVQYTHSVVDSILAGQFSLGIVSQPAPIKHTNLLCEPLMEDPLILVVNPKHPWAKEKGVCLNQLQSETLLLSNPNSSLVKYIEKVGHFCIKPSQIYVCGNIEAIKQGIYKQQGVSIMSHYAVKQELELGLLKEVPLLDSVHLHRQLYFMQLNNNTSKLSTQLFIQFIRESSGCHLF